MKSYYIERMMLSCSPSQIGIEKDVLDLNISTLYY